MPERDEKIDKVYDMLSGGHLPKPIKVLIVLVSLFFGPILALIDKISEKSS